jgi:predicted transcriptional regulator
MEQALFDSAHVVNHIYRRSRMETYCDIIRAIGAGSQKPTHIMGQANLSWAVMQECVKALEIRGFIRSTDIEGKKIYQLTDAGFSLLKQYLSIKEDLEPQTDQF